MVEGSRRQHYFRKSIKDFSKHTTLHLYALLALILCYHFFNNCCSPVLKYDSPRKKQTKIKPSFPCFLWRYWKRGAKVFCVHLFPSLSPYAHTNIHNKNTNPDLTLLLHLVECRQPCYWQDYLHWRICCCGISPVCHRLLSTIPGLYPVGASSTGPLVGTPINISRHCQWFPGGTKFPSSSWLTSYSSNPVSILTLLLTLSSSQTPQKKN